MPERLEPWGFQNLGSIIEYDDDMHGRILGFSHDNRLPIDKGWVYAWVQTTPAGIPLSVLYVGKAGKKLGKRCSEHKSGFRNSPRGMEHAKNILNLLHGNYRIRLYARISERQTILGVPDISMCEAEERALYSIFEPPWNA